MGQSVGEGDIDLGEIRDHDTSCGHHASEGLCGITRLESITYGYPMQPRR